MEVSYARVNAVDLDGRLDGEEMVGLKDLSLGLNFFASLMVAWAVK